MSISKTMVENEKNIKDAIYSGISGDAISSTLNDVMNKSSNGKIPSQVKDTVETIAKMKNSVPVNLDSNYISDFVSKNSDRIKSALNDGITPAEVAKTLVDSLNNGEKEDLNFMVKLIGKIKEKQIILERERTINKTPQKILM